MSSQKGWEGGVQIKSEHMGTKRFWPNLDNHFSWVGTRVLKKTMSTILLYTLWCQGQIFPERFMSFPILYEYCPIGMQTLEPNVKFLNTKAYIYAPLKEQNIQNTSLLTFMRFVIYCTSMNEKFENSICNKCNICVVQAKQKKNAITSSM